LDMDCIIKYHRFFPSWFTMPPLIPSYHICSLYRSSICLHIPLAQLVVNPFDITVWHAFLFFHSWCLSFPP
jgi:hypothetical protein